MINKKLYVRNSNHRLTSYCISITANNTGSQSIYTKWQGYEIMFHVATMLPFRAEDQQQLERKRHIGNDIVIIIFQDNATPFDITSIPSHQNHVVALIHPDGTGYRYNICIETVRITLTKYNNIKQL